MARHPAESGPVAAALHFAKETTQNPLFQNPMAERDGGVNIDKAN
jgi:hypothetical protein